MRKTKGLGKMRNGHPARDDWIGSIFVLKGITIKKKRHKQSTVRIKAHASGVRGDDMSLFG